MKNSKLNIWLVEDDQYLRESYSNIINSSEAFMVSYTFRTGEEVVKALLKIEKPDIIMMDIDLPGMDGVKCTETIKEKYHDITIIMVTVYDDSELVFQSLGAGASGYITKSSNYQQLLGAISEIANGGAPMSSKIAKMVIESFHRNPESPLSKRESQILHLVASAKTFTQISEELFIARETTKTHIRNIYKKLEVNCKADAVAKATKHNLI